MMYETSDQCIDPFFQLSVSSIPALCHTHKRLTCKAAWIFLLGDPDAEAEVCAVKQG